MSTLIQQEIPNSVNKKYGRCENKIKRDIGYQWCHDCDVTLCELCVPEHDTEYLDPTTASIQNHENHTAAVAARVCVTHKYKPLEYFCVDHSAKLCGLCLIKEHRKCDKIDTLESIVNEKRSIENFIADKLRTTRIALVHTHQDTKKNKVKRSTIHCSK